MSSADHIEDKLKTSEDICPCHVKVLKQNIATGSSDSWAQSGQTQKVFTEFPEVKFIAMYASRASGPFGPFIYKEVVDSSDGCGAKFQTLIVSEKFEGKPLLQRHRMVNKVLEEELKVIHAFQMKTLTPDQWEKLKNQN